MARTAKPLEPGDFDLDAMDEAGLMGEVATLTAYLDRASGWRTRRVRAFRRLRDLKVARGAIADTAGITQGAVGNLVDDLNRAEEAWRRVQAAEASG